MNSLLHAAQFLGFKGNFLDVWMRTIKKYTIFFFCTVGCVTSPCRWVIFVPRSRHQDRHCKPESVNSVGSMGQESRRTGDACHKPGEHGYNRWLVVS